MDERIPLLGSESGSVKTHDESGHSAGHAKNESRRLIQACALTTVFFFIELVGGYLAGSLAVMSDAAHLLSDLAGFLISLIAVHVARMPASATMSFGFERAAPLGAFVSMLFIWVLTFVLVVCAVRRLLVPAEVNGPFMVVLGVIGLAFNLVLTLVLGHDHGHGHGHSHSHGHAHSHGHGHFHSHSHSHSHGHDHSDVHSHSPSLAHDDSSHNQNHVHAHNAQLSFTNGHSSHSSHADESPQCGGGTDGDQGCSRGDASGRGFVERILSLFAGSDIASVNLRAAYIHAVGDALQNVGVIVAGIMLVLRPTWTFVDPICTLVFAFVVIWTTAGLARETIDVLMEGAPAGLCLREIFKALSSIDGVERVGDLHVWSISQQRPALSVHLYVSKECVQNSHSRGGSSHELLADAQRLLVDKFSISHATIQINCSEAGCCDGRILAKKLSSGQGCVSPDVLAEV